MRASYAADLFIPTRTQHRTVPFLRSGVSAGKPLPIDDLEVGKIDIYDELIKSERTFIIPVRGDSMIGDQIDEGDLLIVDGSAQPQAGDIVICQIDDALIVKRLSSVGGKLWLVSSNSQYKPTRPTEGQTDHMLGVVQRIIKKVK